MNTAWIGGDVEMPDGNIEWVGIEVDPAVVEAGQRIYNAGQGFISLREAADFAAAGQEAHARQLGQARRAIYDAGYHYDHDDQGWPCQGSPLDRSAA